MNLLKELLNLQEEKVEDLIIEQKNLDLGELVDAYLEKNKMYHFEGSRGISNFDKLIGVIGYSNMDEFLSDNSGCIEAMIEWIKDAPVVDWKEALDVEISKEEEE